MSDKICPITEDSVYGLSHEHVVFQDQGGLTFHIHGEELVSYNRQLNQFYVEYDPEKVKELQLLTACTLGMFFSK